MVKEDFFLADSDDESDEGGDDVGGNTDEGGDDVGGNTDDENGDRGLNGRAGGGCGGGR